MKMHLRIVGENIDDIRKVLKTLATDKKHYFSHSNECGDLHDCKYDFDFVDSDDVFSDDKDAKLVKPEKDFYEKLKENKSTKENI